MLHSGNICADIARFLEEEGLIQAKGRKCKSQLNFNEMHPVLLHCKNHAVELVFGNRHKDKQIESAEKVRYNVQKKQWILGTQNALSSIGKKFNKCRKGRAQTITPVIADLYKWWKLLL